MYDFNRRRWVEECKHQAGQRQNRDNKFRVALALYTRPNASAWIYTIHTFFLLYI